MNTYMSSRHFNKEFESNLSDDKNVFTCMDKAFQVWSSLRNTMIPVSSFICSLNFKKVKHACPASSVDTRPGNKNQIDLTSLKSVKQLY